MANEQTTMNQEKPNVTMCPSSSSTQKLVKHKLEAALINGKNKTSSNSPLLLLQNNLLRVHQQAKESSGSSAMFNHKSLLSSSSKTPLGTPGKQASAIMTSSNMSTITNSENSLHTVTKNPKKREYTPKQLTDAIEKVLRQESVPIQMINEYKIPRRTFFRHLKSVKMERGIPIAERYQKKRNTESRQLTNSPSPPINPAPLVNIPMVRLAEGIIEKGVTAKHEDDGKKQIKVEPEDLEEMIDLHQPVLPRSPSVTPEIQAENEVMVKVEILDQLPNKFPLDFAKKSTDSSVVSKLARSDFSNNNSLQLQEGENISIPSTSQSTGSRVKNQIISLGSDSKIVFPHKIDNPSLSKNM